MDIDKLLTQEHDHTTPNIHISKDENDKDPEYSCEMTLPANGVFSNDIRHNFARMFMNTFNSGDFVHVQNFLRSYMTRSCKVVAQHYIQDSGLKYPPLISTIGSRQFSHHLMGQFTQYPDTIMSMTDCRVITHPNWLGTKVEIDITTSSTKMCSLAYEYWVPPLDKMSRKYDEANKVNKIHIKPINSAKTTDTTVISSRECLDIDDTLYLSDLTIESDEEHNQTSTSKKKRQQKKQRAGFNRAKHARIIAQGVAPVATTSTEVVDDPLRKQPRTRLQKELTPPGVNLPNSTLQVTDILNNIDSKSPYIPEDYSRLLLKKAKPVTTHSKLITRGKMTFYLNESNQLQHMHCEVGQTNF